MGKAGLGHWQPALVIFPKKSAANPGLPDKTLPGIVSSEKNAVEETMEVNKRKESNGDPDISVNGIAISNPFLLPLDGEGLKAKLMDPGEKIPPGAGPEVIIPDCVPRPMFWAPPGYTRVAASKMMESGVSLEYTANK